MGQFQLKLEISINWKTCSFSLFFSLILKKKDNFFLLLCLSFPFSIQKTFVYLSHFFFFSQKLGLQFVEWDNTNSNNSSFKNYQLVFFLFLSFCKTFSSISSFFEDSERKFAHRGDSLSNREDGSIEIRVKEFSSSLSFFSLPLFSLSLLIYLFFGRDLSKNRISGTLISQMGELSRLRTWFWMNLRIFKKNCFKLICNSKKGKFMTTLSLGRSRLKLGDFDSC